MMARKTRTSRSKKSCDSLIKMRLDVSRGPLDLRSWPESQVTTATITAHGRTLPGRRTRLRISRVHDSRRSGTITDGRCPGDDQLRYVCRPGLPLPNRSQAEFGEIKARCAESRYRAPTGCYYGQNSEATAQQDAETPGLRNSGHGNRKYDSRVNAATAQHSIPIENLSHCDRAFTCRRLLFAA